MESKTYQPDLSCFGSDMTDAIEGGTIALPEEKWAPMLASMVGVMVSLFQRRGMDDEQAAKLGAISVLTLAEYFGGRSVYLPRGEALRIAVRDAEIFHRLNRNNVQQLAGEYQLTDRRVYQIHAQQRALHIAKIQPGLWPPSP